MRMQSLESYCRRTYVNVVIELFRQIIQDKAIRDSIQQLLTIREYTKQDLGAHPRPPQLEGRVV